MTNVESSGESSRFKVRGLTASYRRNGKEAPVFSNVSFALLPGDICDVIGRSGSGKSTLLRLCAQMMEKKTGELFVDGMSAASLKPTEWRRLVSLVPQKPSLVPGTIQDNLLLPWSMRVRAGEVPPSATALRELLEQAGLGDEELSRNIAQLSGGQLARVALIRSFATKPRVLLLDEADAALDDASADAIGNLTAAQAASGTTIMRVRHRPPDGRATRTLRVKNGTITEVAR